MFRNPPKANRNWRAGVLPGIGLLLLAIATTLLAFAAPLSAAQGSSTNQQNTTQQTPKKPEQVPAEAGGPQGDIGPIAVPKKKAEEEKPVERAPKVKNPAEIGDFSIRVDVPLVNLDVGVVTNKGQFIPGLKAENFKIYEDGVEQKISSFNATERPITAVLLVEFASTNYYFIYDMLNAAYSFANTLKKDDYVAVISYDMKPQILVDFTQNKQQVYGALSQLRIPGFSETNLFDALYDTLDRVEGVEGHKYIILVSTGVDTFSKLTYSKILDKVKGVKDVTIYSIGTGQALREYYDSHGYMSSLARLDFLQADNQMRTFAQLTGGQSYFPRFEAEMPEIFNNIQSDIRNQYTISYKPTNPKQDGTYRKLKVELVAPDGGPLKIIDQHKKELKYKIIAREGYRAKQQVE